MKSRWRQEDADRCQDDLALRAYTSRLIGRDEDLVLHGGGNTSVKSAVDDLFGQPVEVLYVKGSGWDLERIEPAGFAPVRLDVLTGMAGLSTLSDSDMVKYQRAAMLDPSAPNPSVEAILHAIIPFKFVDHTHADAVVALSNTPDGEQLIRNLYGDSVLIVPYVMPGFALAKAVAEQTRDLDWSGLSGMVLMGHGVFSFSDDARESYERMISLVDRAEDYLRSRGASEVATYETSTEVDGEALARLRAAVSRAAGRPMLALTDTSPAAAGFSVLPDAREIGSRGPLTPDHVIRTKRLPVFIEHDSEQAVTSYVDTYHRYFHEHAGGHHVCLDPAPRWGVWPGIGTLAFGASVGAAAIVSDINRHTIRGIQWSEGLGGWRALPAADIFDVEYWELEQAKLKKSAVTGIHQGRVALVTGAASGIGRACVAAFRKRGAAVVALDVNADIVDMFEDDSVIGIQCDVLDAQALRRSVQEGVRGFGGLDVVVSNAGMFPASRSIEDMEDPEWSRSIELNLSSHQRLLTFCIPFLKHGIDPAIVVVGSKNVHAPGPKASAYSVAKAGLNQLSRVAALELAEHGIRINTVHPNAVFDTGVWTERVLAERAQSYGLSVQEYKTSNLLSTEITSKDVAELVSELAGPLFSKTTGAQIPVDGGNDRVV